MGTGGGKEYEIVPPKTVPVIRSGKRRVSGSATKTYYIKEKFLFEQAEIGLEEDSKVVSAINVLHAFKNCVMWATMDVYLDESASGENTAQIKVTINVNDTVDPLGTGMNEHVVCSQTLSLIELTPEGGRFWNGQNEIFIKDDYRWLSSLIEEVELQ